MKKIISAAALAVAAVSLASPAHADTDLSEKQLYEKVRHAVTEHPENYGLPALGADATNLDKTVLNVANKFLENNNPMGSPQPKASPTFTLGSVSDLSQGLDIGDIQKGVPSLSTLNLGPSGA
ncbi:hypothetical protein [Streptomyces sp. NBC_00239]|uniref:hypothetical protein n=1 Tax=Streptomyces sp. NBC_00239 TaxID=2903640 RepID=UPI002E2B35BB|nr:hypothetical protein [Streptomyces sp. NBC_00239]